MTFTESGQNQKWFSKQRHYLSGIKYITSVSNTKCISINDLWLDIHCDSPHRVDTIPETVMEISFRPLNLGMYLMSDVERVPKMHENEEIW